MTPTQQAILTTARESAKRSGKPVHAELCGALSQAKTEQERKDVRNVIRRYEH